MSGWRLGAVSLFGTALVRVLFATTRTTRIDAHHLEDLRAEGRPVVFVLWHGQLLPLVYQHREEGVAVLVSEHRDGEYVARVLERSGFETVRGSSTRGGTRGLKGLIRAARAGRDLGITPDGPRGPARRFKPGALLAAQVTGSVIVPIAGSASRAWRADSWDRFLVPRPFSHVVVAYGEGVEVPREATEEDRAAVARRLERVLDELTARAERVAKGASEGAAQASDGEEAGPAEDARASGGADRWRDGGGP